MSSFTYVYVLKHEHGFLKIGRADSPIARRNQVQTATPYEVELWKVVRCWDSVFMKDIGHLEDHLHEEFTDDRVRGEWFDADSEDVLETIRECIDCQERAATEIRDAQEDIERAERIGLNQTEVFQ